MQQVFAEHYEEGDPEEERIILQGLKPLSKRLAAILTEAEMKAEDVELSANEHRRLGELFHSIERFDWAADCYHRANDLDPEDEAVLRSLSDIQRKSGDLDSLDRTLERLLAIVPDDINLLNEQLVLLDGTEDERYGRNTKRLEGWAPRHLYLQQMVIFLKYPRERRSQMGGQLFVRNRIDFDRKGDQATDPWRVQICTGVGRVGNQEDQNFGQAWILKARLVAAEAGPLKDAIKSLRRANALGEYTVILESEILENDGRTDASIEVLEEHLRNSPGDSEARGRLSQLWLSSGSPDSARQTLEEAPEEAWSSSTLHIMKGRLCLVDADHHRDETGKVDQIPVIDALVSFDRAIEIDRESGLAWLGRARALRYQGAFDEAEVALVRARRLIPEHPSISLEEAQLFLEIGDLEQANALTLEATTTLKDNQTVPFIRGIIAAKLGRFREAIKLFSDTLNFDPTHARARLNRSSAALLCDDLAMALDDATQLVEERPKHELGRLRRSEILMNQGDWENAESELRELLKLSHNHSMGLVHLGTCMIAMGRSEQAEKPLNKAIEENPKLSEAGIKEDSCMLTSEDLRRQFPISRLQSGPTHSTWTRDSVSLQFFMKVEMWRKPLQLGGGPRC